MNDIQILKKYDEAVSSLAAGLAAGVLDEHLEEQFREQYELFKSGRDALREKLEQNKGCKFCTIAKGETGPLIIDQDGDVGVYLYRDRDGRFFLVSNILDVDSALVQSCPMCGRQLSAPSAAQDITTL